MSPPELPLVSEPPVDSERGLPAHAFHALMRDGRDAVVTGSGPDAGAGVGAVVVGPRRRFLRLVLTPHVRELDQISDRAAYEECVGRVPPYAARWDTQRVAKSLGATSVASDGIGYVGRPDAPDFATAGAGDVLSGANDAAAQLRGSGPPGHAWLDHLLAIA